MFEYENAVCGKEFISYYVSQLYCRFFLANQTIIRKGEEFEEMFMISNGKVTLSLQVKDRHEYFQFQRTNFFGDYQILLNLQASECYTASDSSNTYCYCIKRKELMSLLQTFPDARTLFLYRAKERRVEMRRIKYIYMIESSIPFNLDPVNLIRDDSNSSKYEIKTYTEKKRTPEFLKNPNYYFTFSSYMKSVDKDLLENISDSEQQKISTQEEIEH